MFTRWKRSREVNVLRQANYLMKKKRKKRNQADLTTSVRFSFAAEHLAHCTSQPVRVFVPSRL